MPPKAKTPAPIDRPLSRAYLREFSGWSTEYPPGLSEPTSLRIMENILINRDGSARVRPGLRYLSYDVAPTESALGSAIDFPVVGSHEAFYLEDGSKAYLFAVRGALAVGFRVLVLDDDGALVRTLPDVGFSFPSGVVEFSLATTYVKYLQIDNKIFALSNAGEPMILFTVGGTKSAKKLSSIERPDWSVADKLTVVHPDAAWINAGIPTGVRTNLVPNPAFETNLLNWVISGGLGQAVRSSALAHSGGWSARLESLPARTNLMPRPVNDAVTTGTAGWLIGANTTSFNVNTTDNHFQFFLSGAVAGNLFYVNSPNVPGVVAGKQYKVALDFVESTGVDQYSVLYRFYNSAGAQIGSDVVHSWTNANVRRELTTVAAPAGAVSMGIFPRARAGGAIGAFARLSFKNVVVCLSTESSAMFHGGSGANYFWTGTANASSSVYHPPADVAFDVRGMPASATKDYTWSFYQQAGSTPRSLRAEIHWLNSSSVTLATLTATLADAAGSWNRNVVSGVAPASTATVTTRIYITAVPRGEYHYIDSAMFEQAAAAGTYFDGDSADAPAEQHAWTGTAGGSTSTKSTYSVGSTLPPAETPAANTLISSNAAENTYNFGFFYTFSNEIGDSAASQITVVRAKRPWNSWRWETASATGEPSGTRTEDPAQCADQLVAYMPQAVFDDAIAQGAISWNLYMVTWSDQDAVPVTAAKVATRQLNAGSVRGSDGWARTTVMLLGAADETAGLPSAATRYNYSNPSRAAQGIVAADRMVLVNDPTAAAVIRWTSNQQGSYTDFSASRGGGYKTLTSGNLFIPACVKLWQNPQSADTLTILCNGTDGHSTGYYMAPAQVASQSEAVNIMGFEETTATPGTVSPYGCEVLNNALYHPLDEMLMKSTASNYNINHKEVSEQIRKMWSELLTKRNIVSAQMDNRIYFIVNNPQGEALEDGCMGNELWVFDGAAEAGSWSRFLIQACSLRKIERSGQVYMSVTCKDGIYYLDPEYAQDDYVEAGAVQQRFIPWKLETNTQGANRAHDAWAHLQQANVTLGNFQGTLRYGIRSWDLNGQPVDVSKIVRDLNAPDPLLPYDIEDHLAIRRDLKEWFFYAESVEEEGEVLQGVGQVNLVQYRYTPVSVNVGYEYGSVETFEYERATTNWASRTTDNGVPQPMTDVRRP